MKTPADNAFRAVQIYRHTQNKDDDTETVLTNLLNDLLHFSDEMAVDLHDCYIKATDSYNTQKGYYSSEGR